MQFDANSIALVDHVYDSLIKDYHNFSVANSKYLIMNRRELTFHDGVKLIGLLSYLSREVRLPIMEIGIWKGFSLSLMKRLSLPGQPLVGIDPLALAGQSHDFDLFRGEFLAESVVYSDFSERVFPEVSSHFKAVKLLHIDGGHKKENVVLDFLLYSQLLIPGGLVIFDDYGDHVFSPEVRLAVDMLSSNGYFDGFHDIGVINGFENSYVIKRR